MAAQPPGRSLPRDLATPPEHRRPALMPPQPLQPRCCVLYTQLSNNRRCLRPTAARGHTAYTHCDSPAQRRRDGSTGTSLIAPLQREASCTSICTAPGRGQQLPNATAVCARYWGYMYVPRRARARASPHSEQAGSRARKVASSPLNGLNGRRRRCGVFLNTKNRTHTAVQLYNTK
jgi:hypothetical protein